MMKRIMMVLLMAAVCGASALAQKGMSGIGANIPLSIGQGTTAMGLGVRYYYNVSDNIRLGPSVEVLPIRSCGDEGPDYPNLRAFLNCHIFLLPLRPSRPYIIAGAGYVSYKYHSNWKNVDACCLDLGLGFDFRLSHFFSMQIEATEISCLTSSWNDHDGTWTFQARVGFTYNF